VPFYRYECNACGEVFRVLHKDGDRDEQETRCPHCGGLEATRLLPRIGVIYKGSGYYSTDYRGSRTKAAKEASGDGERKSGDTGEVASAGAKTKADRSES
jgi:putative FmdB family regulatory protein